MKSIHYINLSDDKRPEVGASYDNGAQIISFGVDRMGGGYYRGDDNLYMESLLNLTQSALHNQLLRFKQSMIVGDGLTFDGDKETGAFLERIGGNQSADELISRSALDLVMFGGFAWQVLANAFGTKVVGLQHVGFHKVRHALPSVCENGKRGFYISPNWASYYSDIEKEPNRAVFIEAFDEDCMNALCAQLYWTRDYNNMIDWYPVPDYYGALDYIELDIRLANFSLNNVKNGFVPTGMIAFPDEPSDDEQLKRVQLIKEQYQGDRNAGQLFVVFGAETGDASSSGRVMPEFQPITQANNADIYANLNNIVQQRIISGHGLSSPTLAGLAGQGGLGGNASEIKTAHEYFYSTKIKVWQKKLTSALNRFLRLAGIETEVALGYTPPIEIAQSETLLAQTMTINELRASRGLPSLPGGDVMPGQYNSNPNPSTNV